MDVDVVPVREFLRYRRGGDGIVGGDVLDSQIGEDDAPAEGDAGRIALEDGDVVRGIAQLHRDGEIQPRRPSADAGDSHGANPVKLTPLQEGEGGCVNLST